MNMPKNTFTPKIDIKPQSMAPNISATARKHGISRQTLATWKRDGIDITNAEAVEGRKLTMRHKPSASPDSPPPPGAETIAEAKRRRAVADADFAEMRAQREAGALIDLATVEAAFATVGHELRSRLLALPNAAAAELEGLGAVQIAQALKGHVLELLCQLYENAPAASATPKPAPPPAEKPS